MKKLITTLFVLAALSTAAIAETKLLSVNFAIPLDNITTKRVTNYTNSSTTSSYDTNFTSVGFGFTGLSMFNKIAGLYADVEFGFVQSAKVGDTTYNREGYFGSNGNQFSMNFMLGPAFKIIGTKKIFLSASPVLHLYLNSYKTSTSSVVGGIFGLGADASLSYFFTNKIGATIGFDFAFDFLGFGSYEKKTHQTILNYTYTDSFTNLTFTPKFGLTFRFQ